MPKKTKTTIVKEEEVDHDSEQSTGAKIAVLRNEVKHVNETVVRMEGKMDLFISNSVTQSQLLTAQAAADQKHRQQDEQINELEAKYESITSSTVSKNEFKIGLGVVTTALSLIIAVLAIWEKLKG